VGAASGAALSLIAVPHSGGADGRVLVHPFKVRPIARNQRALCRPGAVPS
jgi:hypothetical protein